jgi:hypothetical protein
MKLLGRFLSILLISVLATGSVAASAAPTVLYGKVVNNLNKPIAGTQITVTQGGLTKATVVTAADGSYSVPVASGAYSISYLPPTAANSKLQAYDIVVPQKSSMSVMLTKPTPGKVFLTGTVSFSNGMVPASDSTVYFGGFQGTVNAAKFFKVTPSAGTESTYTLKTSSGSTFAARLYGQNKFAINQDTLANFVVPVTTQRIRVVTPDGKPVSGAIVDAGQGRFGTEIALMKAIEGLGDIKANWDNRGVTDINGYVTFVVVEMAAPSAAGYQVTPPAAIKYERETFIKTTGAGDVTLTLTKAAGLITGTIKDQTGAALNKVFVALGDNVYTETNTSGVYGKAAPAGTSGRFTMSYRTGSEKAAYDSFAIDGAYGDKTTISGTTTQNFVITRDNVTIKVLDPTGAPMAKAFVTLNGSNGYAPEGRMTLVAGKPAYSASFITKGFTDAAGNVTLKALRYDLPVNGFIDVVPAANSKFAKHTAKLMVGVGTAVVVSLPRPTVTLSGLVKYSDGTPVVNGKLTFSYAYTSDTVTTDVGIDGKYSMTIAKGTRGSWTFDCGVGTAAMLTSALCVNFRVDGPASVTGDLVTDIVLPTLRSSIKVVDKNGAPIGGVAISYESGYGFSPCYAGIKLASGAATGFVNPFGRAITDASGVASLPVVQSAVVCDTKLMLDPGPNSRYEDREILVNLNSGDENLIVLSILDPIITTASLITDANGVTKAYITGQNLLGIFEVKVGEVLISSFTVTSSRGLWFVVPAGVVAAGAVLTVTQGGGSATAIF